MFYHHAPSDLTQEVQTYIPRSNLEKFVKIVIYYHFSLSQVCILLWHTTVNFPKLNSIKKNFFFLANNFHFPVS